MKFKGCSCVGCNNIFEENDDAVVCPVCGSPHHRACWTEQGKCANSDLHKDGFVWVYPEELKKEEAPVKEAPIETNLRFKNGENAVVCPHCKSLNYGNDALCLKCQKPLFDTPENSFNNQELSAEDPENVNGYNGGYQGNTSAYGMPFGNGVMPQEDAFSYYRRFGGLRPDTLVDSIPASEYADYIGEKKSGDYIRKFVNMARFGRKISVSICALLFGPAWFLYRKLYKEGLLYGAAIIILSLLTGILSLTDQAKLIYDDMAVMYEQLAEGEITIEEFQAQLKETESKYQDVVPSKSDMTKVSVSLIISVLTVSISLFMVFSADRLYLKKIKKDVYESRDRCFDMPSYRRMLHEKGGVSVSGAVIGIVISVFAYILELLPAYIYLFSTMAK